MISNIKVASAIKMSYSYCIEPKEYYAVTATVDYMLTAMELSKDSMVEILDMATGIDSIADSHIDKLIEHYKKKGVKNGD